MGKRKKKKHLTRGSFVTKVDNVSFKLGSLSLGWYGAVDRFHCTLACRLSGVDIRIYGYIDEDWLDRGIRIVGYRNSVNSREYDLLYNCNELALLIKDAPVFYQLVKSYINYAGDCLDSEESFESYKFSSLVFIDDSALSKELGKWS